MNTRPLRHLSALCLACLPILSAGAATVIVNTSDRGWYNSLGEVSDSDNYLTGMAGFERRSWFTFDLSTVLSPVASATFVIYQPGDGYRSQDSYGTALNASETFKVSGVTATGLVADGSDGHEDIFALLGNGTSFGSLSVAKASNGSFVTVTLNGAFIAALNARLGGSITIAGVIDGAAGDDGVYRSLFNGSGGGTPSDTRLELVTAAVPEAGPAVFVLGGAVALTALRRRKKS